MSEPNFVPGPWTVARHHDRIVGSPGLGWVAKVYANRSAANVRLIAAAPDLYAALAEMVAMQDRMARRPTDGGGVLPADYGIVRGKAHAALTKARGETDTAQGERK